jgi:hypothetical protein
MGKKVNGASTGSTPDLVGDLVHSGREQFSMVPAHQGELSTAEGGPVGLDLVIFMKLKFNHCTVASLETSDGHCSEVIKAQIYP